MDGSRSTGRSPSPGCRSTVRSVTASVGRTICTQTEDEYTGGFDDKQPQHLVRTADKQEPGSSAVSQATRDELARGFHAAGVAAPGQLCYPQPRAVWQPAADPFGLNVCAPRPTVAGADKWPQNPAPGSLVWSQPLSYAVDAAIRQPPSVVAAPGGWRGAAPGEVKDAANGHGQFGRGQFSPPQSAAGAQAKQEWRRPATSGPGMARCPPQPGSSKLNFDGSMEQGEMLSPSAMAILEQPVCSMVVEGGSDSGGSPSSYPDMVVGGGAAGGAPANRSGGSGGNEQWRCEECGRVLSCAASLRRHRAVHSGVRSHVCNQCGRAFTTQAYLNGHMRSHTGEKPFMCPICARCFTRSTGLTRHMELHVSNKLGSGTNQAGAASGSTGGAGGAAVRHPHQGHQQGQQPQQQQQQQQQQHAHHQQQQVGVPAGSFALNCGTGGSGAAGAAGGGLTEMVPVAPLLATVSTPSMGPPSSGSNGNAGGRGRHQCPICSKLFTRQLSVKVHMRIHTGERPHKCQQCEKTFKNASHLRVHVRTHTNERRYPCGVCGKRFTESSSLRRHMRIHTGERPYECEFCGKEMRYLNHMKSHRRKHTGETPYQCTICGQLFRHQQTYRLHIRKHNGELPTCEVCGKTFSNRARMDDHMRLTHSMQLEPESPATAAGMPAVQDAAVAGTAKARHFLDMMRQHAAEDGVSPDMSAQGLDFRCRTDAGSGADGSGTKSEDKAPSPQAAVDFGAHAAPVVSMPYPLMARMPGRPHEPHRGGGAIVGAPAGSQPQQHPPPQHSPRLVPAGYHPHSSPQQQTHAGAPSSMCQTLSTQ